MSKEKLLANQGKYLEESLRSPKYPIAVVIPIHNDWTSAKLLVEALDRALLQSGYPSHVILVDDGSTERPPLVPTLSWIKSIRIIRLAVNLGHQRAISVGLTIASTLNVRNVVVMDGDGEDRPEDLIVMLDKAIATPSSIICAQRTRRSEPLRFRIFYKIYKLVFRLLTGTRIDFGNFMVIPIRLVSTLLRTPSAWNHLAASVMRSRIRIIRVPTQRGTRYDGESKMNFEALVLHGMSAISVYADVAFIRILLGTFVFIFINAIVVAIAIAIRLLTSYATPGWATTVVGSSVNLSMESLVFAGLSLGLLLQGRSSKAATPLQEAPQFIEEVEFVSGAVEVSTFGANSCQ